MRGIAILLALNKVLIQQLCNFIIAIFDTTCLILSEAHMCLWGASKI